MHTFTLKIKSFDKQYKFVCVQKLTEILKFLGIQNVTRVDLPTEIKKITLLRSPHIYKKSQEQFEIRTYKTNIVTKIKQINSSLLFIEVLKNSNFFGVEIEISTNFKGYASLF